MNLAVLTNILTPYRIPLFTALWKRTDQFAVLLMAQREENRHWQVAHIPFATEVLPGFHLRPPGAEVSVHLNHGIIKRLHRLNPDVVLSGGFAIANWSAWLYCMLFGKQYVGWGELTLSDGAEASWIKRIVRRLLTRTSAGSIASSSTARTAFLHYGAKPESMLTTLLPFDVSSLHTHTLDFRASQEGRELRAQYGGPIVLSVGQLIPRKGCRELFGIYRRVVQTRADVRLLIIGEGPERQWIDQEVQKNRWPHVHQLGHVQPEHLHTYLAIADMLIFPTLYDSFGLVVSEAMAAELPVVASIHAAATHDLIQEGINGFLIDPHDTEKAAKTVLNVLDLSQEDRARIGRAAYDRVKICDPEQAAARMMTFLTALAGKTAASQKGRSA
ncbi:MAG TPA: glycosyltransferase family 4 protein [Nitrospiraceae bacterium]